MDFLIFFTLGTFVGSFFNVVIYRMPRDESIIKPRSHCPACKVSIPFYRNIPLVSFILQVGKCANCQGAISLQYPVVELINGLIWGWSFYTLPFPEAVTASFLSSILIAIAWIDARIYMVPLDLIVAGVVVLLFAVIFGVHDGFNLACNQASGHGFW
jgi:leader peptidase (prepilin peptidase)/N-methyltransferase